MSYQVTYEKVQFTNGFVYVEYSLADDISGEYINDSSEFVGKLVGILIPSDITAASITTALENNGVLFKSAAKLARRLNSTRSLESTSSASSISTTAVTNYVSELDPDNADVIFLANAPTFSTTAAANLASLLGFAPLDGKYVDTNASNNQILEWSGTKYQPTSNPDLLILDGGNF